MDLKYFDDFYNSYGPIQSDYSLQSNSFSRYHNTETADDLTPWDDNMMPRAFLSFKNKSISEQDAKKKKRETSATSLGKLPPKPSEKAKQTFQRKVKRIPMEKDKKDAETLTETTTSRKEVSKPCSRLHSRNRTLQRSSVNLGKQEAAKEEKVEVQIPLNEKEHVLDIKSTGTVQTAQSTNETYSEYFPHSQISFPISRTAISQRIHTTHSFFYFPKPKLIGLKKRESLSRNNSEHARNKSKEDLKEFLNEKSNLIMIRSFRDLHGKVDNSETENESILHQKLEVLKNKLKEKPFVNRSFKEKAFDSKVSGIKTELNEFNKKLTPYGRSNLEKRGKFFNEKGGKPKELEEDVIRNSLKLKLDILRKINRKSQSFVRPKEKDIKSRGSSLRSPEQSLDNRVISNTEVRDSKQTFKTAYLLPLVKDKSNYIKSGKFKGSI